MARAKATRGRGRPAMQNTSPRQTRARSARARAATVYAEVLGSLPRAMQELMASCASVSLPLHARIPDAIRAKI